MGSAIGSTTWRGWRLALFGVIGLAAAGVEARAETLGQREAVAAAQMARCGPAAARAADVKRQEMDVSMTTLLPYAREVLSSHRLSAHFEDKGRELHVELHLSNLRNVEMPDGEGLATYRTDVDAARVQQDPRSRIPRLWRVDESTVEAAALAYNVRFPPAELLLGEAELDLSDGSAVPEGYRVVRLYTGGYTGFAGLVLESTPASGLPKHRIYAIAGTHVFDHTDLRGWASGLTFGTAQVTAQAALLMIRDAAAFATDMRDGGEVFFTGQSQGGLSSQGVGFLAQVYLDALARPHHLVHVVSWGGIGAEEALAHMIGLQRNGDGRGYWRRLETHFSALDPDYSSGSRVWNAIAGQWRRVPAGGERDYIRDVVSRMRVIGYFFEIDMFARAGTFIGTTFAFPTALILPENCDELMAEAVIGSTGGTFGVRLESHFLRGYRRAVARGAIGVARAAYPHKWAWATDLLPTFDAIGRIWLETLYLEGAATRPHTWQGCQRAGIWMTKHNRYCEATHWPGCGAVEAGEPNWCLITADGVPSGVVPLE
jgi:hypothetical protein